MDKGERRMKKHVEALRKYFEDRDLLEDEIWGEAGEDFNFSVTIDQALDKLNKRIDWAEETKK